VAACQAFGYRKEPGREFTGVSVSANIAVSLDESFLDQVLGIVSVPGIPQCHVVKKFQIGESQISKSFIRSFFSGKQRLLTPFAVEPANLPSALAPVKS